MTTPSSERTLCSKTPPNNGPGKGWVFIILLSLLAYLLSSISLLAQDLISDDRFMVLNGRAELEQFYRFKGDIEQRRNLERARIPEYNIDLTLAVSSFHKHISDMHQRHVTCSTCREHVKKIKQLARKIEQGMK